MHSLYIQILPSPKNGWQRHSLELFNKGNVVLGMFAVEICLRKTVPIKGTKLLLKKVDHVKKEDTSGSEVMNLATEHHPQTSQHTNQPKRKEIMPNLTKKPAWIWKN